MPEGRTARPPEPLEVGEGVGMWIDPSTLAALKSERRVGEGYSEVILRLCLASRESLRRPEEQPEATPAGGTGPTASIYGRQGRKDNWRKGGSPRLPEPSGLSSAQSRNP